MSDRPQREMPLMALSRPRAAERWRVMAGIAAVCTAASGPALAQLGETGYSGGSVLPSTGTDVRVGDLRDQFRPLVPGVAGAQGNEPTVRVVPAITVDVGATDNVFNANSPRKADFVSLITPSLSVTADTARLRADLFYAPTLNIYASNSDQTNLSQFLNAGAVATIVPDALFFLLRGTITEGSLRGGFGQNFGGFGANGARAINRDDQVETKTLIVSPYAVHRFGSYGTGEIGYSFSYSTQTGNNATINTGFPFDPLVVNNNRFSTNSNTLLTGNQDLIVNREYGSFTTGEFLGRINDTVLVEANQYDGGGVFRGAHRNVANNDVQYALNRFVTLIGGFGYEDIVYGGLSPVRISDPIWDVGTRLTPNAESSITLEYRHRDGFDSFYLDGTYAPTARTRVYARYSSGLTSGLENSLNLAGTSNVGPAGFSIDRTTGAPLQSTNNFFGIQNNLFRESLFSITGVLLYDRDTITASVINQDRTLVSNASATTPGTSDSGTFGTVQWSHDLTPQLQSNLFLEYGTRSFGAASSGSQRLFTTTATLNYIMTETLSSHVIYSFVDNSADNAGQSYTANSLFVGFRKSF